MKLYRILPLALLTLVPTFGQGLDGKLQGDLGPVLRSAAADQLIAVTIVLANAATAEELHALGAGLAKVERRGVIVKHLKQIATDTQAGLIQLLEERGAQGVKPFWIHNMVGAEVTPALVGELAAREDVSYLHRNIRLKIEDALTAVPAPAGETCGLQLIRAPEVWSQRGINGGGVTVAVIDTGLCVGHPDIVNRVWRNPGEVPANGVDDDNNGFVDDVVGWNFEGNNNAPNDTFGHGSHVSGTVAGDGTGGTSCGVAPGARIMVCKIADSFAAEQAVWDSMQYAVNNGADISTASLGWPHSSGPDRATWRSVCDNTIATGMVVIYAAGNEGGSTSNPDNVRTPGDVPDVMTVGSVDCSDNLSIFSSRGPVTWQAVPPYNDHPFPPGYTKPDVCAEGNDTTSHHDCGGYVNHPGTSMATPHVAGAAALVLQADPTLDHFGVKAILESTAFHLGSVGKNNSYGWGRIDCMDAVDAALPAGNFCPPKPNSCGTLPLIWTEGNPQASQTSGFTINAANMPGVALSLFVYSDQGASNFPILGGHLCMPSFRRGNAVVTTGTGGQCDGVSSIDMNSYAAGALGGKPAGFLSIPGTTVHCQWWARDTANSFGAVLSGGTSYTVTP